jgi:hypothetical protein
MKRVILALLLVSSLFASEIKMDQKLRVFALPDQFGTYHTVDRHTTTIIVSFQKDTGKDVNTFLASKPKNYLQKHDAVFIANISKMPALITKYFAMPKLKKYKHRILLINNEDDNRFREEDEKITIYKLENSVVKKIFFIDKAKEIANVLKKK